MQFLWFYVPGPDNGAELRYSIRSVVQNFQGEAKITVIGERPNWYRGNLIDCPRKAKRTRVDRDAFLDTQNKIHVASTHPEIDDEFVWIMDDVYLLQHVTIEDLKTPRYDPWFHPKTTKLWHKLIASTFNALKANGKPNHQYATHLPHHFEKQKLVELFRHYDYPKNLYIFENLYGNHFRIDPCPYANTWQGVEYPKFLRRLLRRPRKISEIEIETAGASVLNYQSSCYGKIMQAFLESKFPTKTEF